MNMPEWLGKGPGYVVVALFEATAGVVLACLQVDLTGFAAVLTAINVPLFGGGAVKVWAQSKNGG